MAVCGSCKAKNWISSELLPLEPVRAINVDTLSSFHFAFASSNCVRSLRPAAWARSIDRTMSRWSAMLPSSCSSARWRMTSRFWKVSIVKPCRGVVNHTNIIHIYTFDEYEGVPPSPWSWLTTAASTRIEREKIVPELHVLDVGIAVASALATALKGLLHRDIKPGNILYNQDGEPKLVDFGLARSAEGARIRGHRVGTPYYVAPEKIKREGEDFLSDMLQSRRNPLPRAHGPRSI